MEKDPYRRQRILWFAAMNGVAALIAAGLFFGFLYGEALDDPLRALMGGLFGYKLALVLIAMSPLLASLLVGMAYAQRALRKKRALAASSSTARGAPESSTPRWPASSAP